MSNPLPKVATVTLHPAIDRTIRVRHLSPGSVNAAELVADRAGGKGINVAAALAELGHPVVALGFLGRENERVFAAFFAASGIEDACLRLPGATRTNLKIVDPARNTTTDLNFPGLAPEPADLAELETRLDSLETDWCVLAGSLPPGTPTDFYARAIRRLKARSVRVALDTSGEALRQAIAAGPDFIKPNVHELAALVGRELPDREAIIAAALELVAGGIARVVVSCGAEGAYFVSATEVIVARPPRITVDSTVGAGDAMVAGLVAARLRNLSPADGARLATAFSLRTLLRARAGTYSAPTAVDVDLAALSDQIAISVAP